ncbi:family 43 glycosylhydrolase [Cerasicoccus frondis]|uniref:family 43 glycosylhydrolase n=1 Tax=Cerasicoccus frondis TaxID=490090 RepID=UPI0028525D0F|nr:family 43 glycosylhydrolase [Cerasicoccus frondis]
MPKLISENTFYPGRIWPDNRGQHIQAHGGGVIRHNNAWFWFGEDRSASNDPLKRYVSCYSSTDLANWTFRNQVLAITAPEPLGKKWVLERPKVYPNARTGKYVMYFHLDGEEYPGASDYSAARIGVAISDTINGEYTFVKSFRPFDMESRDIGQFIDDDGSPYLIFESRPTGSFSIASLTEDYLNVDKEICRITAPLEGGAIVRHDGLYYCIGSQLTGWFPNANKYATAPKLEGPWTEFKDFAPAQSLTWMSQSTNLIKVVGSETTTVIYVGDRWRPEEHWDGRYLWMPLEIGEGNLRLPPPTTWTLDAATGRAAIIGPSYY